MLRFRVCFLTVAFLLVANLGPRAASSNSNVLRLATTPAVMRLTTTAEVVRLTNTREQAVNLNPSLSDDGRVVVFESSADLFAATLNDAFHAIRADVGSKAPVFVDIGRTRIVSPALSADGSVVAFASTEDLVAENTDRNWEIFLLCGAGLKQVTHSFPASAETRLQDGSFQPSIKADGSQVAFTSRGSPYLYDVETGSLSLLSDDVAANPKISGDGSRVYYQSGDDLVSFDVKSRIRRIVAAHIAKLAIAPGRAVSNDGMRLVYSAEVATNQTQVFLYDDREGAARQLTELGPRSVDVELQPTISGDGKRVAFATRRRVTNASDGSVELYLYDIPSGQIQQITNAPPSATAQVVSSLNFDGSRVVFNFPRILSGPAADEFENNSEIYLATTTPRSQFGMATIFNAATQQPTRVAPGSIATIRGSALAFRTQTTDSTDLPVMLAGTIVKVNGQAARLIYVSPEEVVFVVPDLVDGAAEFVVTNRDGFASKAEAVIATTVPGIFTVTGDGEGDAIVLDADTQTAGPFDPTNGRLRLSIFATGLARARNVSVTINGQAVKVETVAASGLRGLDEIHVLVPAELRGAGRSTLVVTADNVPGNATTVSLAGNSLRDVVINEFLADPPDGLAGDANHDGLRDTSADEFVELVNSTDHEIDLSGYQLQSRSLAATNDTLRHRFAAGTKLPAGAAIVVFGGGSPNGNNVIFGGSQVVKASSGGLSLVNAGGVITLRNSTGAIIASVAYGTSLNLRGDQNQSLTRAPDVTGDFVLHSTTSDRLVSPGTKIDGSVFIRGSSPANIGHALALRSNHILARTFWFRQLPRRPT